MDTDTASFYGLVILTPLLAAVFALRHLGLLPWQKQRPSRLRLLADVLLVLTFATASLTGTLHGPTYIDLAHLAATALFFLALGAVLIIGR